MPHSLLVATAVLFAGCGTLATGSPDKVSAGSSRAVSAHETELGFGRTYRLHVPTGLRSDSGPRPLVVALHGGVASARIFEKQTGLSALANDRDFLVAYPNGIGIFGLLRHWNAQWCCAKAMRAEIDDLGYIDRVIQDIESHWPVDAEAIYVVGYSNGGMLAHQYAATRADRIAGLATFAGPAGVRKSEGEVEQPLVPIASLPVLVVHGKADQRLDYAGAGASFGAADSARVWARSNGCLMEPTRKVEGPIERVRYCFKGSSPVEALLLENWGHEWPGPRRTGRLAATRPLFGFDLATEIWDFFSSARED